MSALLLCIALRFDPVSPPARLSRASVSPVRMMDVRVREAPPRPIVAPRRGARVLAQATAVRGSRDSQPAGCSRAFEIVSSHH